MTWRFSGSICKGHKGSTKRNEASCSGSSVAREIELEEVVLDLGARFFAEKPGAFERRLLRYAREWPAHAGALSLTRFFASDQFAQVADGRVNLLQVPPSSLIRFRLDLAD